MYKIKFIKSSREEMKNIFSYIYLDSPFVAIKVYNQILNTISYLKDFKYLWVKFYWEYRKLVNSKHRFTIIYKIDEENQTIMIVSIFKYKNTF